MSLTFVTFPEVIESDRLLLRAPHESQAKDVHTDMVENFEALSEFLDWTAPISMEGLVQNLRVGREEFEKGKSARYQVFRRDNGCFVGRIGYFAVDPQVPSFEIGYWCIPREQRNGFVGEAVSSLVQYAAGKLSAERIVIRCDEKNTAARRIPERLGFPLEGILRNSERSAAGKLRNMCVYAHLPQEQRK